ncbi:MAG: bacterial transcriptional activator domain-containing protein [Anaerolineae bacterium]|nr:bacterial transcriptional activator domain-containing protein [Anaerolineae bacterium]
MAGFFLPDSESFETWAQTQRQRFRRQAQDALSQLAGQTLDNGDYDAAAAFARRQIEIDNLDEPAHRQLMTALALNGQRNAALAHYGELTQLLTEELAAEPDPETTALARPSAPGNWPDALSRRLHSHSRGLYDQTTQPRAVSCWTRCAPSGSRACWSSRCTARR